MTKSDLFEKIKNFRAKIAVIGLGQVGLPVSLTFSEAEFNVMGFDINETLRHSLKEGKIPFNEQNLEKLMNSCLNNKSFIVSEDLYHTINNSDVIIICVATPISDHYIPDLSALENSCNSISEFPLENKLIIIESSIPPGTFQNLILPYFEKKYIIGNNLFIAYVPERLSPGQAFEDIKKISRVIGSIDDNSSQLARELYKKIVTNQLLQSHVKIAEISKLVENTYRDVNVAFANEIALICERYGVDASELIKICNTHPRVNILSPGPGVGGPCLPKDPYLLLNPINEEPISSKFIEESRKINDNMPGHVVRMILDALKNKQKTIQNSKIVVMGVTYKANISDTRNSPSKEIISQLLEKEADVFVYDPKTNETFSATPVTDVFDSINNSDVIIFVTDHDEFKILKLAEIFSYMNQNPILVDTKRIFDKNIAEELGFHYISIGYKSLN